MNRRVLIILALIGLAIYGVLYLQRHWIRATVSEPPRSIVELISFRRYDEAKAWIRTNQSILSYKDPESMGAYTALHMACWVEAEDMVTFLIKSGADVNARDARGETPIFKAAEVGNKHIEELLINAGADPKVKNNSGQTTEQVRNAYPHLGLRTTGGH